MTIECPQCHFIRRESQPGWPLYERIQTSTFLPCLCGVTTIWRTGTRLHHDPEPRRAVEAA